jgi:predicted dehydrogenase
MSNAKGFAVIGSGLWGGLHARVYSEAEHAGLVAVCDLDKDRASELGSKFGAEYYTDLDKMLSREDIDAVSIVTPDFAHVDIALAAIRAGKHVLVEKPLATTSADCRRIIDAAATAGVKLMVDFHNRWSPPFCSAKTSIERGEVGSVRLIYYRLNDTIFVPTEMLSWAGRSTVQWFIGSHSLDTVTWLIGDKVESVYAVSRSVVLKDKGVDTPDFYEVILEFANGAVAVVENCWILPNSLPNIIDLKCEIVGSEGALYVDGSSHRVLERYTQDKGWYPDVLVMPEIRGKQMGFAAESIRHFIDCVVQDKEPSVTGEDGLSVTELIEAIERSAANGAKVVL